TDQPRASCSSSILSLSLISRCWAMTSSAMLSGGKAPPSKGGGVLLGEDEKPPPNNPGRMMKYLRGSSGRSAPIHIARASGVPPKKFGKRTALSFAVLSVPNVSYASLALGSVNPVVVWTFPSSKISILCASSNPRSSIIVCERGCLSDLLPARCYERPQLLVCVPIYHAGDEVLEITPTKHLSPQPAGPVDGVPILGEDDVGLQFADHIRRLVGGEVETLVLGAKQHFTEIPVVIAGKHCVACVRRGEEL